MAMTGASRIAPLPLRLAVGAVFLQAGYGKLFGDQGFQGFVDLVKTFDLPYPEILAQVAAWGELAGGALLVLGFVTRLAALVNAGTMAVAIWKVKLGTDIVAGLQNNFNNTEVGYQFPLLMMAGCLALLFTGGGMLSVDGMLMGRSSRNAPAET